MIFEGVERSVAQHMQNWISEEFAYISSKREQGISDPNEERRVRCELQLPEFNGELNGMSMEDWVFQLEGSFQFFQLSEDVKLKAAIVGLDGKALQWFQDEHRWQPFRDWQELKKWLLRCSGLWRTFEEEIKEEPQGLLEKMEEVTTEIIENLQRNMKASTINMESIGSQEDSEVVEGEVVKVISPFFDPEKEEGQNPFCGWTSDGGDDQWKQPELKVPVFEGDFGDGFTGGGHCEGAGIMGGERCELAGGFYSNLVELGVSCGPPKGKFERGGDGGSGSGGGPGPLAGIYKQGSKTTSGGGLSTGVFVSGGAGASGSGGGGPGCWFAGEEGGGGCENDYDRSVLGCGGFPSAIKSTSAMIEGRQCDFSSGFSGGGGIFGGGLCSFIGGGGTDGGEILEQWLFGGFQEERMGVRCMREATGLLLAWGGSQF